MTDKHLRIALSARSELRLLFLDAAKRLKDESNAEIHLYCFSSQEEDFYNQRNSEGLFSSIVCADILTSRCFTDGIDENVTFARCARWETLLNLTINRLMVPDRHFGRGYALAGAYHPRSRYSEETSYIQVLHAYCEILDFWDQEFQEKSITLCINGTKEAAHICRLHGIPYRVLAESRVENYHYWAENELYETSEFKRRFDAIKGPVEFKFDTPYYTHRANRTRFAKIFSFQTMLRGIARTILQYGYWNLRGYEKAKGYYCGETMLYFYRVWAAYREHSKIATRRLSDLEGKRFAYFPLHIEPETALHGISPEYFYQQSAIAAVARDLPAGVLLAVKEAYGGIGRRPKEFYRQINDLKNVVWLNCWESGLKCAQQADVVVTICGTAGLEAVAAGTPVISFGKHNLYNILSSVRVITDESELSAYLKMALDNSDRAKIKAEAHRLLRAIVDSSFDLGDYDYIKLSQFDDESVDRLCTELFRSLGQSEAQLTTSSASA